MTVKTLSSALWSLLISVGVATPGLSQTVTATPDDFREAFLQGQTRAASPAKTTDSLVGLVYGVPPIQSFDPSKMVLALAQRPKDNVCVIMLTRDGRYSAAARYATAAWPATKPAIVPAWPSKYGRDLMRYGAADLAVQAFTAPQCDTDKARAFIPVRMSSEAKAQALTAFVNSPNSRVRAKLVTGLNDPAPLSTCREAEASPRIGYTHHCELPLSGKGNTLVIMETLSSGAVQTHSYPLELAP